MRPRDFTAAFLDKLVKMSTTSKHFGLKYKEEHYIFKELEKVRQETKKDSLRFKHKLVSKPAIDEVPVCGLQAPGPAWYREKGGVSSIGPQKPSESLWAKGPASPYAALLRQAPQGAARPRGPNEGAAPAKTRPFRLQDFYLRSSAFLRYRLQKKPPVIASGAGTSRPVVLVPPPAPRERPGARWGRRIPQLTGAKRVLNPALGCGAKLELAPPAGAHKVKDRTGSSISSEEGDLVAAIGRKRVRIRTHLLREGEAREPRKSAGSFSQTDRESVQLSYLREAAPQAPLPMRVIPTSIEEIIASLQSEAQLASDQTIKELIQSILGESYDFKMEDISLIGKMYWQKTSEVQTEQGLQISIEEPQMNMSEELPEATSILQIEQEDMLEWGTSEAENMVYKLQETVEFHSADEPSKPWEDEQPTCDSKVAKQVSLKVKSSESLQIRGKEVERTQKSKLGIPQKRKPTKHLRDQKLPKKKIPQDYATPTLHDLCITVPAQELPIDLCLASRVYHTADKKGHSALLELLGDSFLDDHSTEEEQRHRVLQGIPVTGDTQANVPILPTTPGTPPELAQGTRQRAHKSYLQLLGEEVSAYPGLTKLFWNVTSPKFSVPVSVMKETLYPKYESVQASRIVTEKFSSESKESDMTLNQHSKRSLRSLILRKSLSFDNISKCFNIQSPQLKRVKSAVELRKEGTIAPLEIKDDMQNHLKEVMFQKAKELKHHQMIELNEIEESNSVKKNIDAILDTMQDNYSMRNLSLSLIEASRKAGISYIVYPRKKKMKWKKGLKFSKLSNMLDDLSKPPKILKRSMSHGILPGQRKYLLKVPLYERQFRCPSLPSCLNFDKFTRSKGGIPENRDPRTWVIDMFSKHKPQKTTSREKIVKMFVPEDLPKEAKEPPKLELSDSLESGLPPEVIKHYESEVEILTEEINNKKIYAAFSYCRRGAIYRKLGKLQSAMNDLQEAILLEPLFLNAYWHRHLIYLFQDKIDEALDDLNYINKCNKNNAEAYFSKAEIFRGKKDITLAILNYTQAIKCKPMDADMYFRRGEMYEITNKVLAIDDFSKCIFYDPKRIDALLKRGMFYYENGNWNAAIQDFTALLHVDPQNSEARTYRGRAYFKRCFDKQATEDFSVAIHLDPNNWVALYYRACIFRKSNPLRALQDYSVSALINDGYENFSCFLHRGILYADLKLWSLAICDFETVISLERTVTLAYINIGLIYLLHLDDYFEASWYFSEAIRLDPSCIQSYICQAEAYYKLHNLKRAVRELSRAIHLQPDGIKLYIIRGQYLLMMKCYDLAKFTIYQVAEMNKGLIELSPIQQAFIYSFCENHDKAIQVLDGIILNKPEITTYTLLGKAQMKAKRNKEAVIMFKKALEVFSHSQKGPHAIEASVDCLYNLGLCYMEEGNLQMAFDSFTKAVKANPNFAAGFYQRGLCKVKLQKESSILDFNRAITLDPQYYEAYLSRVAFYGMKGRYSKAILNCNEAIKIYPQSVRAYLYRGVLKYSNKALTDYGIVLLLDAGETVTLNTFINRGLIYKELEQYSFALEAYKLAIADLTTAINMHKNNYIAFYNRALCYTKIGELRMTQGKFQKAWNHFTIAIDVDPKSYLAYEGRAMVCLQMGDNFAAIQDINNAIKASDYFSKALKFNPENECATMNRAIANTILKKYEEAREDFANVVESCPFWAVVYFNRAQYYCCLKQYELAEEDLSKALSLTPNDALIYNLRAEVRGKMGVIEEALADYNQALDLQEYAQ
ncbi:PREDICTED: tetratricopeptide repeat protein 6 [Hipposideros armiger]|uniref:Tetratricopeptide repeat protein 6 n=1 Tax=Hipposideros armiger TaxID=186990 RepID=A0A8B7RHA6_HIPAR|nr:PREDICTED: tetratricopeptide repeat protein 6 [Hipposideros armiger]